MVTVHCATTDKITAWRVRDNLARHPLLGGAAAEIAVEATHAHVTIRGRIPNDALFIVVGRLTRQSAGRRTVEIQLRSGQTVPTTCTDYNNTDPAGEGRRTSGMLR